MIARIMLGQTLPQLAHALTAHPNAHSVSCPNCGAVEGIYARADIRWQPMTQSWEIKDIEADLDCTNCDHNWPLPDDWPRPLD